MKNLILIILLVSLAGIIKGQSTIDGYLNYNSVLNFAVSDVILKLKQTSDNTFIGEPVMSDSLGYYKFVNVPDGKYVITCLTSNVVGGIDALDALYVNRNYLGSYDITDLLRKLAANVNADKSINPTDALLINKRYMNSVSTFKAGDWLFEQDTITVSGSNLTHNIKALCFGDVDASFTPEFKCGDKLLDKRDKRTYKTVLIGKQCWMADNLNIGSRVEGANDQTDNYIVEKYCYNNDENNCNVYGGLYQWDEMMQYRPSDNGTTGTIQGICPAKWHIPTDAEWKVLEISLGMTQSAADSSGLRGTDQGGKMKETGTTHWSSPNTGAINSSGFTVLPGGARNYSDGVFYQLGDHAYFWSSMEYDATHSQCRNLYYNSANVERNDYYKTRGFSVRCVKD